MSPHEANTFFSEREMKAIKSQFDDVNSKTYYVVALDRENDEISINPQQFLTPYIARRFIEKMERKYPEKKFVIVTQEVSYRLDAIIPPGQIDDYVVNENSF